MDTASTHEPQLREEKTEFLSADGTTQIHAYIIWPEGQPKAVFQIVHGMAEHISRYRRFAEYLAEAGYVVCGHDQIGHGTSSTPERWGKLPLHNGDRYLVRDIHHLFVEMQERTGDLPAVLFGHSLGSYLVRAYLATYHDKALKAAIICGTGHVDTVASAFANGLAIQMARRKGPDAVSPLLHGMADGSYAKAVKDARTDFDWLSYSKENVDRYIEDPACGFPFSIGGYATVTAITRFVCSPDCFASWEKDLPIFFVAGAEDPVGSCGKGVDHAVQMARDAGMKDVSEHLYAHMRHEILNEEGADEVLRDILVWTKQKLGV